jgi:hypothetical protein
MWAAVKSTWRARKNPVTQTTLTVAEVAAATQPLLRERPDAETVAYALEHFLSFRGEPTLRDAPQPVVAWLEREGFQVVLDEVTSDGYWHIVAFRRDRLEPQVIIRLNAELQDLAKSHDGIYDGWDVMRNARGVWIDNLEDFE